METAIEMMAKIREALIIILLKCVAVEIYVFGRLI